MSKPPISSIEAHFEPLPDPRRVDSRTPHKLLDIVVITICGRYLRRPMIGWRLKHSETPSMNGSPDSWNYRKASRRMIHSGVCLVR